MKNMHIKKTVRNFLLAVAVFCAATVTAIAALFHNELWTLCSLRKLDSYGMYCMTYHGDYGFDDFLKDGAKSDRDIEKFVIGRLLHGIPINLHVVKGGCTSFVTRGQDGKILYGRNFDFSRSPSLQLYTRPENGYASVSTVNLLYLGYGEDNMPADRPALRNFLLLAAPFLPFDGMNEKGVAVSSLAVPEYSFNREASKPTLNTTTVQRLVLDKASSVQEAVDLLRGYNIYFSNDISCHFLIADSTGASVIIEYIDGAMQTVWPDSDCQIASNFIAYNGMNLGEGFTEFQRYDAVKARLEQKDNPVTMQDAAGLLNQVGIVSNGVDKLQWSVIYDLTDRTGKIWVHRKEKTFDFTVSSLLTP